MNFPVLAQEPSFIQLNGESEFTITGDEQQYITLSFLIKEGYHIQSDKVKDESLIPSELSFDASDIFKIGDPVFPAAEEFWMEGVEEPMEVFSDVLKINVPVTILKPELKGPFFLKGNLHYQACDDSKCYFPRDLNINLKINKQD